MLPILFAFSHFKQSRQRFPFWILFLFPGFDKLFSCSSRHDTSFLLFPLLSSQTSFLPSDFLFLGAGRVRDAKSSIETPPPNLYLLIRHACSVASPRLDHAKTLPDLPPPHGQTISLISFLRFRFPLLAKQSYPSAFVTDASCFPSHLA